MSLWVFASAMILAYPAGGFGQAAGWEEQRHAVLEMREQGRLHEALEIARTVLAKAERHEPDACPLPLALHDYAVISGDLSLYAEAERALRRAIRLLELAPTRDDPVIQILRLRLGEVLLDAGRDQEAKALFLELQRIWEQTQPESAELATVLDHLAWIDVIHRKLAGAESLLQRSIRLIEARTDVSPVRIADIYNDYASLLFSLKRYADAETYCMRVQSLFNRHGTGVDATLINTWMLLGATYAHTGRVQEGEAYMRRAISASQSIYGEYSLRAGRLMSVGAALLQQCGEKAAAKSLRKEADQILAKANREDPGGLRSTSMRYGERRAKLWLAAVAA